MRPAYLPHAACLSVENAGLVRACCRECGVDTLLRVEPTGSGAARMHCRDCGWTFLAALGEDEDVAAPRRPPRDATELGLDLGRARRAARTRSTPTPDRPTRERQPREVLIQRGKADPSLIPHGSRSGYSNWACRCEACSAAERERNRTRTQRRKAA